MSNELPPVLGKEIPWKKVRGEALRVKSFSPIARIVDGDFSAPPVPLPYAMVTVECPGLPCDASILVSHKVDFCHLWELYEERKVQDDEEVLLFYDPVGKKRLGRLLRSVLPCLAIYVYPKGHLEEIYDPDFHPQSAEAWFRYRAKWEASEGYAK